MLTEDRQGASGDAAELPPTVETRAEGAVKLVRLAGDWTTRSVASVDRDMQRLRAERGHQSLTVDMSGVDRMDTAGAWLVESLIFDNEQQGVRTSVSGASQAATVLLDAVRPSVRNEDGSGEPARVNWLTYPFETVGKQVYHFAEDFMASMYILGATIRGGQMKAGRGHSVNPAAIVSQIYRMGVGAIPVVALMSFIVGAIVAQQGAFQLRYFGAEIFVVDLVGILILRELGVLMTAIMIAGRSGSAITAEIGSMKMREEVDALKVIGLNPVGVLVFPRLVALLVAMPCLTVIANFAAFAGAMSVAWSYSGISPEQFIDRLRVSIDLSTIFAGLIKAPFMALIIGTIASVEGLQVGGSAESLGRQVTASVVKAIFVVVIVDGLFAMFYAAIEF